LTQLIREIATVDFIQLCHVGFFVYGQFFVFAFIFIVSYVEIYYYIFLLLFFCFVVCLSGAIDHRVYGEISFVYPVDLLA
jgi:hypothetical protein